LQSQTSTAAANNATKAKWRPKRIAPIVMGASWILKIFYLIRGLQ
jgi:hypothetical protein